MLSRIIKTVLAFLLYGMAIVMYAPQATLLSGRVAGRQLDNADTSSIASAYWTHSLSGIDILLTLSLVIAFVFIWAKPVKNWLSGLGMLAAACFVLQGTPARAYFATMEKTEAYTILPNESAFWIPDAGANRDNQVQLDSGEYLRANKIAAKRFVIPRAKLGNSGGFMGWDYYVPAGRLIIVD
jgi:hypothetical protein